MFLPLRKTLRLYEGSDFELTVHLTLDDAITNIDWTDWTASMMFRENMDDEDELFELTHADGITLYKSSTEAYIRITITKETIATVDDEVTRGYYDLELTDGDGTVGRFMMGRFRRYPEVTR